MAFFNDSLDDQPIPDGSNSFEGGMYSDALPKRIGANQAALMVNIDLEVNGNATTRRGVTRLGTAFVEDGGAADGGRWIQGLHAYNWGGTNNLYAVNNRFLWKWNSIGAVWTHLTGYAAGALPAHTQIPVSMTQLTDKLYLSDAFANIFQFDGAAFVNLGSGGATQPPFGCSCIITHTERLVATGCTLFPQTVAFSDILDGTTWSTATQEVNVGGDGAPISGAFSWVDFNILVFKRPGIFVITANPSLDVAEFQIKPLSKEPVSVTAWRTAAQVGTDVMVLTDELKVRRITRTMATETQQDLGNSISIPVEDILRRVNRSVLTTCHAISRNDRYILFVALDASTYPNYALVYNNLTQSWSGYWTAWDATHAALYIASDGTTRLAMGDSHGRVKEWLDYVPLASESITTYLDEGSNILTQFKSRAMLFGDEQSPKTGLNYRVTYASNTFGIPGNNPTVYTLNEGGISDTVNSLDTIDGTVRREAFDLGARGQFEELQLFAQSTVGKLSLKNFVANAFQDSMILQSQ